MCLPGARASAFRTTLADTWIRVFGGDESLIEEIRRNRQIQEGLPQNHPGRAFAEAVKEGQSKRPSTEEHHTTKRPRKALVDITNTVQPVAVLHPIVGPGPSSRPGQKKFRSLVIARVQFNGGIRCECTGTKRDLDAAHIVPYCRGDGKYSHGTWATNGLLLHRAIHTVWDAGLVKLTPNPPFEWVDVDENGIEAMYGGLSTWIVTQLRHNGLRGDILDGMTSEDQKIFIDNIKTRFER